MNLNVPPLPPTPVGFWMLVFETFLDFLSEQCQPLLIFLNAQKKHVFRWHVFSVSRLDKLTGCHLCRRHFKQYMIRKYDVKTPCGWKCCPLKKESRTLPAMRFCFLDPSGCAMKKSLVAAGLPEDAAQETVSESRVDPTI